MARKIIDLSQPIYQGMYVYPGHLKTVIFEFHTHEETAKNFEGGMSYRTLGLLMSDHGPTHVDAICHFDPRPDAPCIDEMPLEAFYGEAICLDVSHIPPQTYITKQDLQEALARHNLEIKPGDIVLLYTGTYNRYHGTKEYLSQFPGLDGEATEWLIDQGVKNFGVDAPTPDNPISRTYPCHMTCRTRRVPHYENLANLDQVAGKRFLFIGFPLRIRGGTGSPVRAVAILEE